MFVSVISKIQQNDSIVIFGHINPDGDCYGSQIALREILKENFPDKKIYAVGSGIKNFFDYLGHMDIIEDQIIPSSLAILVDSNDIMRLEDKRAKGAKDFVKIDHHINTFSFVEGPEIVDTDACSTAELIYRFAKENDLSISPLAASALYLGILTDTGRFQYVKNFVYLFSILEAICHLGAEPKKLNQILNMTNENSLHIKSFVYSHYQKKEEGIIYLVINKVEREALGVTCPIMASNVTLLGNVVNYPVWLIVSETDTHGMQVELRSSIIDVQKIAVTFGGGGHHFASGFTYKEFSQELVDELLAKCSNALKEINLCGKNN